MALRLLTAASPVKSSWQLSHKIGIEEEFSHLIGHTSTLLFSIPSRKCAQPTNTKKIFACQELAFCLVPIMSNDAIKNG